MNLEEERYIRQQIRRILNEEWGDNLGGLEFGEFDLGVDEKQFYDTFIGPFVDVVNVASVGLADVASAAIKTIEAHLTFDLKKKQDLQKQFREDRKKYAGKMEKAMKSTFDAFNSNDAKLVMFMMNPGVFLAGEMLSDMKGAGLHEPVTDFVGSKLGGFGDALGIGSAAATGGGAGDTDQKGPLRGLMNDLKVLFFGEGLDEIDEIELVLKEQDEEKKEKKKYAIPNEKDMQEEIEAQLEELGIGSELEGYQQEILDSKKAEIAAIKTEIEAQVQALNELQKAQSLQDAQGPLAALKAVGVDLTGEASKLEQEIKKQAEVLKAGGKEAEELLKSLSETPEGKALSPDGPVEDWLPILEKSMLAGVFGEVASTAKNSFGGDLVGFVGELSKDELKEMAASSKAGADYVKLVDEFEQWLTGLE